MAKSNLKYEYDENGHWIQERNRIKGAIRRAFRLSPQMKEVLQNARVELPPALKKNGTPGKRPQVRYMCACCRELFSQKNVQVDHIKTVVPLWIKEADMSYDEIVRGVFCNKNNLQVLCSTPIKRNGGKSSCHKKKTDEENWLRKRIAEQEMKENGDYRWITEEDLQVNKWFGKMIAEFQVEYQQILKEKEAKKHAKGKRKTKK